ncbi:hypothetical protein B7486_54975, partial [cyanobacterium TDX16]
EGIGNDEDLVGRFLAATPFFYGEGTLANPEAYEEELGFATLCSRQFDEPGTQKAGKLFLTMNYETPNLDIAASMAQGEDAAAIQAATTAPAKFQLYGNMSPFSVAENRVTPGDMSTRFRLPTTMINTPSPLYDPARSLIYEQLMEGVLSQMGCSDLSVGTYPQRGDHAACTTRMASDPSEGVVDHDLTVFGTDNVVVLSNAAFPTMPAANPTLTLVAMILSALRGDCGSKLRS